MYMYYIQCTFFCMFAFHARPAAGRFSRSPLRGKQGARLYTKAQAWFPTGLRGARSGRSKPHDLASRHGIVFRDAGPVRPVETPRFFVFFFRSQLSAAAINHTFPQTLKFSTL